MNKCFLSLFFNEQTFFSNIFPSNSFFYNFTNPQFHPSQKNLQILLAFLLSSIYVNESYILIHLSICLFVCRGPEWAAPSLKCSSARCESWWRRDTCSLDPPSPRTNSLSVTETRSRNEPPGLKCSNTRCKLWWRRNTRKLGKGVLCSCELSAIGR
jgi:hypothetical protein